MTLIEQKQVQTVSKLSAQIHCQLSKYRNHIQNGEWHKVTCPEEHQTDGRLVPRYSGGGLQSSSVHKLNYVKQEKNKQYTLSL